MRHATSRPTFFLGIFACFAGSLAAAADSTPWATGAALQTQLAAPVTVSWSNLPFSRALKSLGAARHLAIVLDRRIDPDQPITLSLDGDSLQDGLRKIARHVGIGYCQLGPIAYFGPGDMARRLRTLAALRLEEIRPLPTAISRKFLKIRGAHWEDLAEPRKLLAELADEADVTIRGAEKIPHDLWPAADLPPMLWVDRLTLLAAQFDLAFRVEQGGREVELLPAPDKVAVSRSYLAGRDAAAVAKRWAKAVPEARVAVEGNKIRVEGTVEDHETVEHRLRAKPTQRTTVTAGEELYRLTIEKGALDGVLAQVADRLHLKIEWDRAAIEAAGISSDQLVTFAVRDASLDELLRAALAGTGLAYRRDERVISIFPAEASKAKR